LNDRILIRVGVNADRVAGLFRKAGDNCVVAHTHLRRNKRQHNLTLFQARFVQPERIKRIADQFIRGVDHRGAGRRGGHGCRQRRIARFPPVGAQAVARQFTKGMFQCLNLFHTAELGMNFLLFEKK